MSAWADSQCVAHCIRRMAAPRRSTPHCCASVYCAKKPSLGGRGTAASAVVDEGRFLTFTAFCWSFLLFFPHPSALRAATFSREKVLGCCKRQCVKHQFVYKMSGSKLLPLIIFKYRQGLGASSRLPVQWCRGSVSPCLRSGSSEASGLPLPGLCPYDWQSFHG